MINKLVNNITKHAGDYLSAVTPIDLFNKAQMSKLRSSSNGFQNFWTGFGDMVSANMRGIDSAVKKHGSDAQISSIADYMGGAKIGQNRLQLDDATASFRKKVRARTAMAAGAYLGSSLLFGSDSGIASGMRNVGSFAAHGVAAAGLAKYASPLAGMAYAGLGIHNMMKPGNNMGPF